MLFPLTDDFWITPDGRVGIGTKAGPFFGRATIHSAVVPLSFFETDNTVTNGGLWRMPLDNGNLRFDVNTGASGDFSSYITAIQLRKDGEIAIGGTFDPDGKVHIRDDSDLAKFTLEATGTSYPVATVNLKTVDRVWAMQGRAANFRIRDLTANKDRLFINSVGEVGIGTTSPSSLLDVAGTLKATTLTVAGTTTTGILTINGGSDLAESFEVSGKEIQPGMVLSIDPENPGKLRLAREAYDSTVAGIISGAGGVHPGMTLSQQGVLEGKHPVALAGRVYCWVDASFGAIRPGDLLTSSSTPGHAMKVADRSKATGAILGKALSPLPDGRGLVLVVVTLQ